VALWGRKKKEGLSKLGEEKIGKGYRGSKTLKAGGIELDLYGKPRALCRRGFISQKKKSR